MAVGDWCISILAVILIRIEITLKAASFPGTGNKVVMKAAFIVSYQHLIPSAIFSPSGRVARRGTKRLVSVNICSLEGNSGGIFVSKVSPGSFVIKEK